MPLTKQGKKVLTKFRREYGKNIGKSIFYTYMNLHPRRTSTWHRKIR